MMDYLKLPILILLGSAIGLASFPVLSQPQSLEERVARLERITDNPVLIQLSRKLGLQQSEIQSLQDKVDRLEHTILKLKKQSKSRYKEMDDRFTKIEHTPLPVLAPVKAVEPPAEKVVKASKPEKGVNGIKSSASSKVVAAVETHKKVVVKNKPKAISVRAATSKEQVEYKVAFDLIRKKNYKAALKAFVVFKTHHPKSVLSSNASYWAGESAWKLGKKLPSLAHFEDVVVSYPKSMKAPDSLLRAGDVYRSLDQLKLAKSSYQKLLNIYPKAKAAKKAASRLKALK